MSGSAHGVTSMSDLSADADLMVSPAELGRADPHEQRIVDVRSGFEFRRGHIHGSTNLPLHRARQLFRGNEDPPPLLVSLEGVRAALVAAALRLAGRDARALGGGIRSWERLGLPVEKGAAEAALHHPAPQGLPEKVTTPDGVTERFRTVFETVLGVPFTEGNHVTVLTNGDEIFPAMFEAISSADKGIDFLSYVYWKGEVARELAERLAERAAAGVRVRVLLDAFGAKRMDHAAVEDLRDAGVTVEWFHAVTWRLWNLHNRTHRKILVVDGRIGFTGGVGIAKQWDGDGADSGWRDTHFRIEGPAVRGLEGAFVAEWMENGHPVVGHGDDYGPNEPAGDSAIQVVRSSVRRTTSDVDAVFRLAVRTATESLRISTAYFNPDGRLLRMLCDAAHRGVRVEVITAGHEIDKPVSGFVAQRNFDELLDAGVRIHLYRPAMFHVKTLTVDGELAVVGSANLNSRSLHQDDEVVCVILDPDLVARLDDDADRDLTHCERVDPHRWRDRSLARRFAESAVRLVRREA